MKCLQMILSLIVLLSTVSVQPAFGQSTGQRTVIASPAAKKGGTFYSRIGTYPRTLNRWRSASDMYTGAIGENILESLVDMDYETWTEIPWVAHKWDVASDKLSATFYLRKDVKFSDGSPVTADDIIFTWDTIFNEKNDTAAQRGFHDALKSWKKIDSHTVKFEFNRVHFENISRVGGMPIMSKKFYSKSKKGFDKGYNKEMFGSGPYVLDKQNTKQGRKITLKRNPNYWGKDLPEFKNTNNFDKIVYRVIKDDRVAFETLKKGKLSMLHFTGDGLDIWAKELGGKEFNGKGKLQKLTWPKANPSSWGGVVLNMREGPTANNDFREVLQIMFDSARYTQKIFHGLQAPLLGPFGNFSEYGSPKRAVKKFDPKKAKSILEKIGYKKTDSDGVLVRTVDGKKQRAEITIMFSYAPHEKYLTIFAEDCKNIGLKVNLKYTEWAAATKLLSEWKFDGFVMGWGGNPTPAPSQLWHGKFASVKSSSNYPGFDNKHANELIEKAPSMFDKNDRLKLFHELEDIIVTNNPYLWRWQQKDHYVLYNKELVAMPKKTPKYAGDHLRGQMTRFYWHPAGK